MVNKAFNLSISKENDSCDIILPQFSEVEWIILLADSLITYTKNVIKEFLLFTL